MTGTPKPTQAGDVDDREALRERIAKLVREAVTSARNVNSYMVHLRHQRSEDIIAEYTGKLTAILPLPPAPSEEQVEAMARAFHECLRGYYLAQSLPWADMTARYKREHTDAMRAALSCLSPINPPTGEGP